MTEPTALSLINDLITDVSKQLQVCRYRRVMLNHCTEEEEYQLSVRQDAYIRVLNAITAEKLLS